MDLTHACYGLAYLSAVIAALCWWESLMGVKAEIHEDDWQGEANSR